MTVLEAFRIVAPEFSAMPDAAVEGIIEFTEPMLSESKFGKLYPMAHAYLVAHWLAWQQLIAAGGSGSGMVTAGAIVSEKEGDLSRSYANAGSSSANGSFADNMERTAYGLEYKRIARMVIVPVLTRMG